MIRYTQESRNVYMRRFNPDKELYKIQHGNKNKVLYGIILLLLIISIGSTYALYQVRYSKRIIYTKVAPFSNRDINILAVYIDNQPTTDFPKRNTGYKFDHIECDNNSTATFDTINWQLILKAENKDKCSVYFTKEKDGTPNSPELYQGLIPVVYKSDGTVLVADGTQDWYNYDDKRWANAVLVDNTNYSKYVKDGKYQSNTIIPMTEILQMYVWIPRYKYQLFNVDNGSINPQEIQITFENGTTTSGTAKCSIDTKGVETCTGVTKEAWYTHPAFTFGSTQLKGIWVGKFESSGSANALTIQPNSSPWRQINIQTMFNASRNIEETNATKFNLNKEEIDTHMMKNIEWGAMAYLTHSKYGRCNNGVCTEVTRNTMQYVTGYNDAGNLWYTSAGQSASTTGTMYGIYDTNGDAWEYVMANMVNTNGSFYSSSAGFSTAPDSKYYDVYEYDTNYLNHARGHLGDATREVIKTVGTMVGGWYDDYTYFPFNDRSWFIRGGRVGDLSSAGTYAFYNDAGEAGGDYSFRVVISCADM